MMLLKNLKRKIYRAAARLIVRLAMALYRAGAWLAEAADA